jgi:hypothetical protein
LIEDPARTEVVVQEDVSCITTAAVPKNDEVEDIDISSFGGGL